MKEKIKKFFEENFSIEDNRASNMEIKATMVSGAKLKGPNMCILVLAIIIACIGLNMNSTATVIGAMLISPLMGCILGIGYGISTNDLKFAKKSFFGLMIQVIICIITSTIYFMVSPISTTSHELLARTSPTIWDVLIAVAGGLAGIIGLTRKEKTNVIPGVAIATAIMPPLCTAGFGIATMQWKYFLGAIYLFFINAFFICLSSIIVLKLMKMPKRKGVDEKEEKRVQRNLVILSILTILPSIIIAYQIVNDSIIQNKIQTYITKEFQYDNTQVVSSKIDLEKKKIEVAVIGKIIEEDEIVKLTNKLQDYQLQQMNLKITQTEIEEGISKEEVEELIAKELQQKDNKLSTTQSTNLKTSQEDNLKDKMLDIKEESNIDIEEIKNSVKTSYNKIQDCTITKNKTVTQTENIDNNRIIVSIQLTESMSDIEKGNIEIYLKEKLGENLVINYTF